MDVIGRIEHGMADIEDAARVRKLVAALIAALDALAERGVDAGAQAVMRRGLDVISEVLRDA
jgi:hypothetical protein